MRAAWADRLSPRRTQPIVAAGDDGCVQTLHVRAGVGVYQPRALDQLARVTCTTHRAVGAPRRTRRRNNCSMSRRHVDTIRHQRVGCESRARVWAGVWVCVEQTRTRCVSTGGGWSCVGSHARYPAGDGLHGSRGWHVLCDSTTTVWLIDRTRSLSPGDGIAPERRCGHSAGARPPLCWPYGSRGRSRARSCCE